MIGVFHSSRPLLAFHNRLSQPARGCHGFLELDLLRQPVFFWLGPLTYDQVNGRRFLASRLFRKCSWATTNWSLNALTTSKR